MVRWFDPNTSLAEDEIRMTVRYDPSQYPIALAVSSEETVCDLKVFVGVDAERYIDEMSLVVSMAYPYPLSNDMRLGRLLVEHRDVILRFHEGGVEDGDEDGVRAWWAQPVPLRYLQTVGRGGGDGVLDLRYLAPQSIPRIRSWLYHVRGGGTPVVKEVWLLGVHPKVDEILYALAEDVLSLGDLRKVWIQHPESEDYHLPHFSRARHDAMRKGAEEEEEEEEMGAEEEEASGWVSYLQRDALMYVYQHLAADRYRNQVEQVEIVVDGNVLTGQGRRGRWRP